MSKELVRPIQSVARAMQILDCFDKTKPELSLSELSNMTKLNISTLHGIINTMYQWGYIDKNPDSGRYSIGVKFLIKSHMVSETLDFKKIAKSNVSQIVQKYGETAFINVYKNNSVFCLEKLEPADAHRMVLTSVIGTVLPFHASCSGKIVLAYLPQEKQEKIIENLNFDTYTSFTISETNQLKQELEDIRQKGIAYEKEETEIGAECLGVPVFDYQGRVIGTISMAWPTGRITGKEEQLKEDLKKTAMDISKELGYFG